MSLTITGLHVIQRSSLHFSQCIVRKTEIKLSNMHTYKLQIYILWQEWNKESLWGDNRENMVNILFMHSCSKILKHLSLSTLYFLFFFLRFTKCWGAEMQHYSHWPSQLYIKVKILKGFLFTPFYQGHVVPQTCNEGLYKQARWEQYDYNVWHSDKILEHIKLYM